MATKKKKRSATRNKKRFVSKAVPKKTNFPTLSYQAIEREIQRLTELLNLLKRKSSLVRRSLAYLEREQKKVARQINEARRFLNNLKNRGIRVLRNLPENAEELYYQLKGEFTRLSKRLRA